ncbi:hypothetical protein XH98_14740 [Bradyrhizobium sp. CCBAU 51745]|uniref:hypothetical protein n=1 Tax=Bradyrhizobium sp. CCBAU 51745 TaxID=1325099 RepID=UPI0023061FE0|nr:hypothetical protein [Bradyrhizobium sp. CCBAU 51745]MDA9440353.1 hypothetical protein [Bradyrhizobium sp. CCBAU 51745]
MTEAIEHFVTTENIRHFGRLLKTETHPGKCSILLQLLMSEVTKLPEPAQRAGLIKAAGPRDPVFEMHSAVW